MFPFGKTLQHRRSSGLGCPRPRAALLFGAALLTLAPAQAQTLQWATSYNGINASALEEAEGVVADGNGGVFVTGLSYNGTASAIRTLRVRANGTIQWTVVEQRASLCGGMWGRTPMAQDSEGNLWVVGAEFTPSQDDWNPLLLKISATGTVLTRQVYSLGPFASFDAVTVDGSGGLYVAAHNNPNNGNPHVVHTLRLGSDGGIVWQSSFTPSVFWGTRDGIVVTSSGVFTAAGGRLARLDSATGAVLWEQERMMPNGGSALAADAAGNIYLAPLQSGVIKLDPAGNPLLAFNTDSLLASDLDVDGAGNIYLTGSTPATNNRGSDILTQRYNAAGNLIWGVTHGKSGPYSDDGLAVTVRDGFVFVGGSKYNKNLDMGVLKYSAGN